MGKLDGSCMCGNLTFTCDADPIATAICHCTTCQKQTGSAYSLVVLVPKPSFELTGDTIGKFETTSEDTGGKADRIFCTNCGSPIATMSGGLPDVTIIKAGTIEDRSGLEPAMEVFCDSAIVALGEGRMHAPRMPAMS